MPPDATATTLGANTESHSLPEESQLSSTPLSTSTNYLCGSCQISFENGQEQRTHMKSPWHVYNIKRRVDSLPPISLGDFETETDQKAEKKAEKKKNKKNKKSTISGVSRNRRRSGSRSRSRSSTSNEEEEEILETEELSGNEDIENYGDEEFESVSPFQCLFCNQEFANDDEGFAENLEHMSTVHGMVIPDQEMVEDMQSLVGYLATEVRVWHECLYCGATKPSTVGIQNHMRDKGHCLLNLDREPELLEFWESPELVDEEEDEEGTVASKEGPTNLSATEIHLASGRVIGSKHMQATPGAKKASRRRALAASTAKNLPSGSEDAADSDDAEPSSSLTIASQPGWSRQLARRDEMSIAGISVQQRQALVLAEKKAQRSEAVARRAREWVYAKHANQQKFDQLDNQMKLGKQNHKLLPR